LVTSDLGLVGDVMSGHSKWAKIHRQKEVEDAAKGRLFSKLVRAISLAVKKGGPNPQANASLRVAIEQAKSANMPKENIERAISKADKEGEKLEEITYEGFGPAGIAVVVEVATDNRNRTGQEIKNLFERAGGRLAGPGAVSFNFVPKGYILIKKNADVQSQMLKLIDLGIDDVEEAEDGIEVYTSPDKFFEIQEKISENKFEIISRELIKKPKNFIRITDPEKEKKALDFLDALSEHEDVQNVFSNVDIPE